MGRRRVSASMKEAAAALSAAAVAAASADDDQQSDIIELDDAEIADDVLEGLRRLDQGGTRVTWYVYCDSPIDREGFVEKLKTEQLDEQRFKTKYGPGEYRVLGRTSDGHYVKGSHKVIKISGILSDAPAAGGANDAVSLLREMRAADEKRAQQRADELKSYASILVTPLATVAAAIIARRPALDVPALIAALRPQQSTLGEMTTALLSLKQMSGDGGGGGSVDVILKVIEKLQDLPSGGSGDTGWLGLVRDVIKEAAPPVRDFLTQLQHTQRIQQGVSGPQLAAPSHVGNGVIPPASALSSHSSPVAPSGSPTNTLPPTPPGSAEGADVWHIAEPWLRRKAEELHESAATNMDVELCAEHLLQSAEKKFGLFVRPAQLYTLLLRQDWWQHVTAFYPPLEPYGAWCNDVRQALLGMLEEDLRSGGSGEPDESAQGGTNG